MKKLLFNVLRWGGPVAILAYLFYDAQRSGGFQKLHVEFADVPLLLLALLLVTAATVISIYRWYVLVRALRLKFSFVSALRLGFLAELLSFVAIGTLGADLVKATFIAHEQPGRRTKAVTTVLCDRIVGLYSLFLLASLAILATARWRTSVAELQLICHVTLLLTVLGTFALIALVAFGRFAASIAKKLARLRWLGGMLSQVVQAFGQYRRRWRVLILAVGLSLGTHALLAMGIFLIAWALTTNPPSVASHLVMVPMATAAGVIPLSIGPFEFVLVMWYQHLHFATAGEGFAVALGYRMISIGMAIVGAAVYFAAQGEVSAIIREAASVRERA